MRIYPAIDMKNGQCVRLFQGDLNQATVFNDSPLNQAAQFETAGFSWLHMVDLDGAVQGLPVNIAPVKEILAATKLNIQLGGGIRTMEAVQTWLEAGVKRVILGTAALKNKALVEEACKAYPGRVVVGIDARGGKVAAEGWVQASEVDAIQLARQFEQTGVAAIVYTDIARDGTLQGPNIPETLALARAISIPVIASGGVSGIQDVHALKPHASEGIEGVIIGRAFYEGRITPEEALRAEG